MSGNDSIIQIVYNIIGGGIVGGFTWFWSWGKKKWYARNFKQIFQDDEDGNFHLIYKSLQSDKKDVFPPEKSGVFRGTPATTNVGLINSCADTRSVGYLVYAFGKNIRKSPIIVSHVDVDKQINLSFISIGGPTNHKTRDIMAANSLIDYENGKIVAKVSRSVIVKDGDEAGFDYGFIVKIHPTNFPRRAWICSGGIGVWGCSGAAWYLAHRWNDIRKLAGKKEFVCITKTRSGIDEDTYLLKQFQNNKDIENYIKEVEKKNSKEQSNVTTTTTTTGELTCTEIPPPE